MILLRCSSWLDWWHELITWMTTLQIVATPGEHLTLSSCAWPRWTEPRCRPPLLRPIVTSEPPSAGDSADHWASPLSSAPSSAVRQPGESQSNTIFISEFQLWHYLIFSLPFALVKGLISACSLIKVVFLLQFQSRLSQWENFRNELRVDQMRWQKSN